MRIKVLLALFLFSLSTSSVNAAIEFTINNPQVSGDEVTIDVSIANTSSVYYLQGMFTAESQKTNYLGWTKNNYGDFVRYVSSPEPDFITTNFFKTSPENSNWIGKLTLKTDIEDDGYSGPGNYILKVKRFTANGSGTFANNSLIVQLNSIVPTSEPTESTTPNPTNSPTPPPTSTPTSKPPSAAPSSSKIPTLTPTYEKENENNEDEIVEPSPDVSLSPEILGENTTPSPEPTKGTEESKQNRPNMLTILGSLCLLAAIGVIAYQSTSKHNAKITK